MFLINKKYIDEIKKLCQFEQIEYILKNNSEFKSYLDNHINKLFANIKTLKQFLNPEFLKKFSYERNVIQNLLNSDNFLFDNSPKHLNDDQSNNLFYYENFQIIDRKLFDLFKDFDSGFQTRCIKTKIINSYNQIILFLEEKGKFVINIGKINNKDEFVCEYLIQASNYQNNWIYLNKIYQVIKEKGYYIFKTYFIKDDLIKFQAERFDVKAKIYRVATVFNNKSFDLKKNEFISEKLKGLILISISQNIDIKKIQKYNSQKIEKIYLMNYNSLLKYKFEEICQLINSNNEIKNFLEEINDPQSRYDSEILEKIISKLNKNEMKKIDEEIKSVNFSSINLEAKADKIFLENGASIFVYKEFIFIREKIFSVIKSKLSLYSITKSFNYAYKDGDILAIQESFNSFIFFGNYNKESHLFNLRYILKFDKNEGINTEFKFILNNGIERYKEEKTIFNEENNKDLISAI